MVLNDRRLVVTRGNPWPRSNRICLPKTLRASIFSPVERSTARVGFLTPWVRTSRSRSRYCLMRRDAQTTGSKRDHGRQSLRLYPSDAADSAGLRRACCGGPLNGGLCRLGKRARGDGDQMLLIPLLLKAPLVQGSRPETDQQCPIAGYQPFSLDPPAVHLGHLERGVDGRRVRSVVRIEPVQKRSPGNFRISAGFRLDGLGVLDHVNGHQPVLVDHDPGEQVLALELAREDVDADTVVNLVQLGLERQLSRSVGRSVGHAFQGSDILVGLFARHPRRIADAGGHLRRLEDVTPGIGLAKLEKLLEACRIERPDGSPFLAGDRLHSQDELSPPFGAGHPDVANLKADYGPALCSQYSSPRDHRLRCCV